METIKIGSTVLVDGEKEIVKVISKDFSTKEMYYTMESGLRVNPNKFSVILESSESAIEKKKIDFAKALIAEGKAEIKDDEVELPEEVDDEVELPEEDEASEATHPPLVRKSQKHRNHDK